jgi:hypothetical protein
MTNRDAVTFAKEKVMELFGDEAPTNIGLEEVEQLGTEWIVTLGFSRKWDQPGNALIALNHTMRRSYKIFKVIEVNGAPQLASVKDKILAA